MKYDLETLQKAAKVAKLSGEWAKTFGGGDCLRLAGTSKLWAPHTNDGDAFRLANQLGIEMYNRPSMGQVSAMTTDGHYIYQVVIDDDINSALRWAIVRAAALMETRNA